MKEIDPIDSTRFVQERQYLMLLEVDRICRWYKIPYFLCCGTLLGTVRHGGPIPWDDDLDVGMLRDDYEKFIDVAGYQIKRNYFIQTWNSDSKYALPHCKIRDISTRYVETVSAKSGCNDGISIDVLPFDNVPNTRLFQFLHGHALLFVLNLIKVKRKWEFIDEDHVARWKKDIYFCISKCLSDTFLIQFHTKMSTWFNQWEKNNVTEVAGRDYYRFIGKKQYYKVLVESRFRANTFFIPASYDKILRKAYGNYMMLPPESQRKGQPGVEKVIVLDGEGSVL